MEIIMKVIWPFCGRLRIIRQYGIKQDDYQHNSIRYCAKYQVLQLLLFEFSV